MMQQTQTYPAATAENVTYACDNIVGGNKGKGRLMPVTDQSGSTSFVYDALGRVTSDTRVMHLRFPGQVFQIETGLAYNHHRHYDPIPARGALQLSRALLSASPQNIF